MELGGGSRNNKDGRGRNVNKHSLHKLKNRPLYEDNLSDNSVEEVEVEKPQSFMEKENIANQKLKDFGHQEDVDTMSYEEKIQLIMIYEESAEMAALDKIASNQYHNEAFEESHIVDVEDDPTSLFQTQNTDTENINRLRSRNVSVVKINPPSSTVTREEATSHINLDSLPSPDNSFSSDEPSQVSQNKQAATLHLRRPPLSKPDPSIPFTKEVGLRVPAELAARRKEILKKMHENDFLYSYCSDIKDPEEQRKIIAERLKLQSKIIFQSRIKKRSNGRTNWVFNKIPMLTEAQSVRFFKEWRAKKEEQVEYLSESPNTFDDVEPMDETEPSSSRSAPSKVTEPSSSQSAALKFKTSQIQDYDDDGDFVDKKKKSYRLSTKYSKAKSEKDDLWLSKDNAEVENKNANTRNASRRKLYSGLVVSRTICDNASNGKRKRYASEENSNKQIVDKFDELLDSSPILDIESAKRVRDEAMSPEF